MSINFRGRVFSSSFDSGIKVILEDVKDVESIEIGRLAVIEGSGKLYLCVVDSLEYSVDRDVERLYSELEDTRFIDSFIRFVREHASKHVLNLIPVAEKDKSNPDGEVREVVSLPSIGSTLHPDQVGGVKSFYGAPDYLVSYPVGSVETVFGDRVYVPIPLDTLYNLSFGIFGKSGTGKTFLANLLIAYTAAYNWYVDSGVIRDRGKISLLIFDTQGEYSQSLLDDKGMEVIDGACSYVNRVSGIQDFLVYALDPEVAKSLGCSLLKIPLRGISIGDLFTLLGGITFPQGFQANIGDLKRKAEEILKELGEEEYSPYKFLSSDMWVLPLLYDIESSERVAKEMISKDMINLKGYSKDDLVAALKDLASRFMALVSEDKSLLSSLRAGRRRLSTLLTLPISFKDEDIKKYREIASKLLSGQSVVINMGGRYGRNPFVYMAVANYLGETIISVVDEEVSKGEYSLEGKIAIYLEEAHRFLGRDVSFENPFGRIAREYRKYGLIVIPIDQRPRELDPNVVAMLWSKFIFNLEDERDAEVATTGLPMKKRFRDLVVRLPRGSMVFYSGLLRYPVVLKAIDVSRDVIPIPDEMKRDLGREVSMVYEYIEWAAESIRSRRYTDFEEP